MCYLIGHYSCILEGQSQPVFEPTAKMSQSWGKCAFVMPKSATNNCCTAPQNRLNRGYLSNIHICLSRCRDDDCRPDVAKRICLPLFGICFSWAICASDKHKKTDIKSHSMTCTALCWVERWGRGMSGRS